MNIKPLSNNIVINPIEEEKKTDSGIILPETAEKEKPQKGEVVAVGPGKINERGDRISLEVKVGDIVIFKKYGPNEFKIDGNEYLIANENDIIAVID